MEGLMVKNGLLMELLLFNYYGWGVNVFIFYYEIYNSDEVIGEFFVMSYWVDKIENGIGNIVLLGYKCQDLLGVNLVVIRMDIGELFLGNY